MEAYLIYILYYIIGVFVFLIQEYTIAGLKLIEIKFKEVFKESLIWPLMYAYLIAVFARLVITKYIDRYKKYNTKKGK